MRTEAKVLRLANFYVPGFKSGGPVRTIANMRKLSDRTPWKPDAAGALIALPLGALDVWRGQIERAADKTPKQQNDLRRAALEYARGYAARSNQKSDNLKMFMSMAA